MKRAIVFTFFLLSSSYMTAQECPAAYRLDEVRFVKTRTDLATDILKRMHTLGIQCNQFDLNPTTQRAAMNAEFQALKQEIKRVGEQRPRLVISTQTREFLRLLLNPSGLGLDGTVLDAGTREEALAKTYEALEKTVEALVKIEKCL